MKYRLGKLCRWSFGIIGILCLLLCIVSCIKKAPENVPVKTGDVKVDEKPRPLADGYQLKPLVTETLGAVGKEQRVTVDGKVSVVIPPGGLAKEQKLTISEVDNPPPASDNTRRIGVYGIKFDEPLDIPDGFTLEFNYDPSVWGQEVSDDNFFEVEFYDELNKMWLPVPVDYDEAGKVLKANVTRNGMWQVVQVQSFFGNHRVLVTDNFAIFYNLDEFYPKEFDRLHQLKAKRDRGIRFNRLINKLEEARRDEPTKVPALEKAVQDLKEIIDKDPFTDAERSEIIRLEEKLADIPTDFHSLPEELYKRYDAPRYIVEIAYHGENAWKKYKLAFDKEPYRKDHKIETMWSHAKSIVKTREDISTWESYVLGTPFGVEVSEKFPVYVQSKIVHPRYYGRSGSIYIGIMSAMHDYYMAHELFHGVQNKDYWMGMKQSGFGKISDWVGFTNDNNWWFESTADYAANRIVLGEQHPTAHKLNAGYFSQDFFSARGSDDYHPYRTAWFWDYLVHIRGVSFPDLYKSVAGASTAQSLRTAVENGLKSRTGMDLGQLYYEFSRWAMFDGKGPFRGEFPAEPLPPDVKEKTIQITLSKGLRANIKGLIPQSTQDGRFFEVKLNPAPIVRTLESMEHITRLDPWWIDVYRLRGNKREAGSVQRAGGWRGPYVGDKDSLEKVYQVEIAPGDGLYIVFVGDITQVEQKFEIQVKELDKNEISGYWKLVKTENAGVRTSDRWGQGGKYITGVSRNGYIEAKGRMMKGRNLDVLQAMTLALRWTPPPATAKPGDKWDGHYKAEVLEDIDQGNRAGEFAGKNTQPYTVKGIFGYTGADQLSKPDRLGLSLAGVHMIQGHLDPRLQQGTVETFPSRLLEYKYLCMYVEGSMSLPMGGMQETYYYFYEWTLGLPPGESIGQPTVPGVPSVTTPAPSPAPVASPTTPESSPSASGDDYQERLSAAKARYEEAFSRYTTLTTTGGTGSVQEALNEYREAHRALKELKAER